MNQQIDTPTLSTVIPCHNGASTLARAILSAINQAELNELVVVVDASSDNSALIAQQFAQSDPRVRVIDLVTRGGPGFARNIGAAAATGDILCFLDSDDEHLPGYYKFAKAALTANPQWGAVKSGAEIVGLPADLSCEDSDPRYAAAMYSAPWNLAMRRPLFWLVGGFPQSALFLGEFGGEDIALNRAFHANFPVAITALKFCRHYNHHNSHLERFLRRATVVDGEIVVSKGQPDKRDLAVNDAVLQHVAQAAANRSVLSRYMALDQP